MAADTLLAQRSTSRRTLLVGAAASLLAAPATPAAAQNAAPDPAAGQVESVRGEPFAERTNARRALGPAAEVFVGDLVQTDQKSGVVMKLGTTTTVKLGGAARFRIDKFVIGAGGTLDLERGPLIIDRDDPSRKENLQVRSPFGLIAVRGTMFFAGPSDGVFGVFVGRGAVSVSSGGRTVNLHPGQGTNIARPGDPPSDAKPWGDSRIKAALASAG
jgi:uncharacterized membrane protein